MGRCGEENGKKMWKRRRQGKRGAEGGRGEGGGGMEKEGVRHGSKGEEKK